MRLLRCASRWLGRVGASCAVAVGLGAHPAAAAGALSRSFELTVLSYNVKAIPWITDLGRLKRIGEILRERRERGQEPDLVLLQEAFSNKSKRIQSRAGYPYQVAGTGSSSLTFENGSGLEILSDFPIRETYSRSFDDCAFPDCLVDKSILGVAVQVPELPFEIQIFNTHLQAQTPHDEVRKNQVDDIEVFLQRLGFGDRPAILAGDFNFKPRHASYQKFRRELPFQESGLFCLQPGAPCRIELDPRGRTDLDDIWKSSHDRQFYYALERVRIEPIQVKRNFTERIGGENLSDHWGYEVRYRISW
jgi:endonuclease/exonuclease/phosphatase family metal-dependent hydrolase